jgi:hypothetical protein
MRGIGWVYMQDWDMDVWDWGIYIVYVWDWDRIGLGGLRDRIAYSQDRSWGLMGWALGTYGMGLGDLRDGPWGLTGWALGTYRISLGDIRDRLQGRTGSVMEMYQFGLYICGFGIVNLQDQGTNTGSEWCRTCRTGSG